LTDCREVSPDASHGPKDDVHGSSWQQLRWPDAEIHSIPHRIIARADPAGSSGAVESGLRVRIRGCLRQPAATEAVGLALALAGLLLAVTAPARS
jgi:hypothetical protein